MKTKSFIFIILILSIFLSSCGNKSESKHDEIKAELLKSEILSVNSSETNFSNPAFINGSNFGMFFISMLRTQNYDMALDFTSKSSINKFGLSVLKEKYKNFKFDYNLKLVSESINKNDITLKFTTSEFATGKFKEMTVVVENDSCKLILPDNLDEFLK